MFLTVAAGNDGGDACDGSQLAVAGRITSHAVRNALMGVPAGTSNLLLNTGRL